MLLAIPMFLGRLLGVGADFYLPTIRIALAVFSLLPFPSFFRVARDHTSSALALFATAIPLLWPENLDFVGSTLSDALVAPLFAWAVVKTLQIDKYSMISAGMMAAAIVLAFCIRFEIAPSLSLLGLIVLWRLSWRGRAWFAGGLCLAIALVAILDLGLGQIPFREFYLNFVRNISDGIATQYGAKPPSAYLEWILQHWGLALLLAVVLALCELKRTWLYLLAAVAVLLPLMLIGHKEYRFYYPATVVFTLGLGMAVASFSSRYGRSSGQLAQVSIAMVVIAAIGTVQVPAYLELANQHEDLRIVVQQAAAKRDDLCGLGSSYGMSIVGTAGLAFLHRDVNFDTVSLSPDSEGTLSPFNYLIVDREGAKKVSDPYTEVECWAGRFKGGLCLYRREGPCSPSTPPTLPAPGR